MSIKIRHIGLDPPALDAPGSKEKPGSPGELSFEELLGASLRGEAASPGPPPAAPGLDAAGLASLARHVLASRSLGLMDGLFTAILLRSLAHRAEGLESTHLPNLQKRPGPAPGALCARFESGGRGAGEIGYDPVGGTSYGVYQISSRAGTFRRFVDYLRVHAPRWALRLEAQGSADTGGTGGALPDEWRRIAQEDPEGFAGLQYGFIFHSHYLPALKSVEEDAGLHLEERSRALKEVLFSTAVQHGAKRAAEIFARAARELGPEAREDHRLIEEVYRLRKTRFGSSGRRVRRAVLARFRDEMALALDMLRQEGPAPPARA